MSGIIHCPYMVSHTTKTRFMFINKTHPCAHETQNHEKYSFIKISSFLKHPLKTYTQINNQILQSQHILNKNSFRPQKITIKQKITTIYPNSSCTHTSKKTRKENNKTRK